MLSGSISTLRKTADQSVTSSTVLVSDSHLSFPVAASTQYHFRFFIPFSLTGIISGYKFAVAGPSAPTNFISSSVVYNGVTNALLIAAIQTALATLINGALATIGNHLIMIEGVLNNNTNAGNLTLQFAQNASDGSAITVLKDAVLIVTQLN